MAEYNLGSAEGKIVISFDDDGTKKARKGLDEVGDAGTNTGKLGDKASKLLVAGMVAVAAAAAVATVAAVALGAKIFDMGFDRAVAIENAEAKMRGLGKSTEEVDAIMKDALASVKGTAFGLDQAASLAAVAVSAGIKPGQDLQRELKLVANAAAAAGTDMGEMGGIMRKVWTDGRVDMEIINQLSDRGIPIFSKLAEAYGVSGAELREMVSSGKVDMATFTAAMEASVGTIAAEMGNTFTGSVQNAGAALSRLGALFASPTMEALTPVIQAAIGAIDRLAEKLAPVAEQFSKWLIPAAENFAETINGWDFSDLSFGDIFKQILELRDKLVEEAPAMMQAFIDGISTFVPNAVNAILSMIPIVIDGFIALLPGLVQSGLALVQGIISGITLALPGVLIALAELIPQIITQLILAIPALILAAQDLVGALVQGLILAYPVLMQGISDLIAAVIPELMLGLPKIIEGGLELFLGLVDAFLIALPQVIDTITEAHPQFFDAIKEAIPELIDAGVELFKSLIDALTESLPDILRAIIDITPDITDALIDMIPELIDAGVELFVALVDAIIEAWPEIKQELKNQGPKMDRVLQDMIPILLDAGRDLIGGLVDGLWEKAGDVGDTLLDIANDAVDDFLAFLGIHSPSRLFRGYGENVIAGLLIGLDDNGKIAREIEGLASAMSPAITAEIDRISEIEVAAEYGSANSRSLTYNAAENSSFGAEEDFFEAMHRAKVLVPGW